MRVLIVSDRPYMPQQVGGREWVIHETARDLMAMGHAAFIMVGLNPSGWLYIRNRIRSRLTRKAYPADRHCGHTIFRGWCWERGLGEISRQVRPDAVLLETRSAAHYLPVLERLSIPAVVRLHDTALHLLEDCPKRYPRTQFVAVSQYLADRFRSQFDTDATVIRPLVRKDSCETPTSRKKVVFVNPRPVKGGDIAVSLAERCPEIPFKFYEAWLKDEQVKRLEVRARALPNVEWVPSVMDPRKIYEDAHTVLFPSRSDETWGRVASEAHINGIPVIASDAGALPESVGPGGIIVPKDAAIDAWVSALKSLWNDRERYEELSRVSRTYADRAEVSATVINDQLLRVLEQAVGIGEGLQAAKRDQFL